MKSSPTAVLMRRTISTGIRRRFAGVPPPGVGALVGTGRQELIEQITFAAHDLDTVILRGLNGSIGALMADALTENGW